MGWHLRISHSGPQLPPCFLGEEDHPGGSEKTFLPVALTDNITVYTGPANVPSPLDQIQVLPGLSDR